MLGKDELKQLLEEITAAGNHDVIPFTGPAFGVTIVQQQDGSQSITALPGGKLTLRDPKGNALMEIDEKKVYPLVVLYGLRIKSETKLLHWSARGVEEPTDSGDVVFELGRNGVAPWLVTDPNVAEVAARTNTEWYNADYTTPVNPYAGKCEVVKLVMVISTPER